MTGRSRLFRIVLGTLLLLGWLVVACESDGATSTIPATSATGTPSTSPPITTGTPATESTVSADSATATALPEPALEIIHHAGRSLTLRGVVSDQATADRLLGKAQQLYAANRVVGELTVGNTTPTGGTITLTGEVRPIDAVASTANAIELAGLIGAEVDDQQTILAGGRGLALTGLLNALVSLEPITFEIDSAVITAESEKTLTRALGYFEEYPEVLVLVEGHTDSDGSDTYNFDLSEQRAESVLNFLVANGVAPNRLRSRGFGETTPVADNATEDGKAANRRIEFSLRR